MSKRISINKEDFIVNDDEFNMIPHAEFNNLNILDSLGTQERLVSLLKEISKLGDFNLKCINTSHGGYIPIKLSNNYKNINVLTTNEQIQNVLNNKEKHNIKNIVSNYSDKKHDVLYINNILLNLESDDKPKFLLCDLDMNVTRSEYKSYILTESNLILYVLDEYNNKFIEEFKYFISDDSKLNYDNLIHLTMIVKNAGDNFENILSQNLPFIDRWTILDTGSTDNTVEIINRVLVGKKKGNLYQEPFINFRDSRNRCLDLAGTDSKFIIMLDDTYLIQNDLRTFLVTVRGDQFSDSFSLYIKSNDSEYGSNRIIKSETKLRYKYKLHEVISPDNNKNVIIPMHHGHILDHRSDYMENRTMDRKKYDLKILYEMVEEEPDDSRALYYLGQTYNLLERYESALEFFLKRVEHKDEGFIQEKIDACFEAARLCNFKLNRPWTECEKLYKRAYEMDKSRPDSLYFLGIHYYLENDYDTSYEYMKKAFEIGYQIHCQYSLKPTLSYYFLPKFLSELSFMKNNIRLGKACCDLFLEKNEVDELSSDYYTMKCWNKIYTQILDLHTKTPTVLLKNEDKPYFVIHANGGFTNWTGKDIETKGVGGSETWVIEIAKYVQKHGYFNVVVFCNCSQNEEYNGVQYRNLNEYNSFILDNNIHTCIISRYPEYLPVSYKGNISNIYLILHDLIPSGEVIIRDSKLKNIFCLSEWHCDNFKSMFKILEDLVIPFGYGIDTNLFKKNYEKQKYKFIYSSFPHRGLLPLLKMWPRIKERYTDAVLHIHSDIDGSWVNSVRPEEMMKIKEILPKLDGIVYEGWTDKKKLAENWSTTDVWFYPCTFLETFCLTALESAISKTLVVTSELGALQNTVKDRGIVVKGDAYSEEWQEEALRCLFNILEDPNEKNNYINKNYEWAKNLSWENRTNELLKIILKDEYKNENDISSFNFSNILNYFNFLHNNKNGNILKIGKDIEITNFDKKINNEIIIEEDDYVLVENEDVKKKERDISEILNEYEKKKFDMIICSKMGLGSFEYYTILVNCWSLLKHEGMLIFVKDDCVSEFMSKYINNIKVLEKNNKIFCIEKILI